MNGAAQTPTHGVLPAGFFQQHCIRCHGPEKQEADLRIDTLDTRFRDRRSADTWVEILDRINLGEMPPDDEPQPTAAELELVVNWITGQLKTLRHRAMSSGGRVLLRRLTRTEYSNTVRDLLGVEFLDGEGPRDMLPPDGSVAGFTKVSKGLLLDPSLMEKYLTVAQVVAERAVRVRQPLVPTRTMRFDFRNYATGAAVDYRPHRTLDITKNGVLVYGGAVRTGHELQHPFNGKAVPITGRYTFRVRAGADPGHRGDPIYMDLTFGRQGLLQRFRVDAPVADPQVYEFEGILDGTIGAEALVHLVNGSKLYTRNQMVDRDSLNQLAKDESKQGIFLRKLARYRAEGFYRYGGGRPDYEFLDMTKAPKLYLDYIELEGPINGPWPPRSMSMIFPGFPGALAKEDQTIEYARQVFTRLLPQAYRRPVTSDELNKVVDLVATELELGKPFHEAIRVGIVGMLCAPQFLYLFEPSDVRTPTVDGGRRPLTDFELATRLSYFLWSSMPDKELLHMANTGLRDNLDAQINRMLADEKAEALVNDFAYQWLRIGEFDRFAPDRYIYPDYYNVVNEGIGEDMKTEPLAMFREVLRNDRSLLSFLDSKWTVLNARLADFYGIQGVTGKQFRPVSLPAGSQRGGLLGMAGLHKWGSDGNRTKPVARGKYILEVLFNDPPPPPPPNAGEVQPNVRGENLTVRERLAHHRTVAACANCHRRIDPYGLAMENFNAIGQWRTKQDGEMSLERWGDRRRPLDVSGTLPNGDDFSDFTEFKQAIVAQSDRFLRGLSEKMLVYGVGRPLEPSDQLTIENVVTATKNSNQTLRAMIKAIVNTEIFQSK